MNDFAFEMHVPRKGSANVLRAREIMLPPPGPEEVRVAIEAAGVAYVDIYLRRGLYESQPLPQTPGYDFVGRIEALGENVKEFAIGQRVAGVTIVGSYASRRNVDTRWLVPAPEGADARALVAVVLNGLTAWQMFHRIANPHPGEWVLVHGAAGGVGSLLLDLAALAAVRAIGTASSRKHFAITERGGVPIDYAIEDIAARARAISGGGVVAAFDHLGGRHLKKVSVASLRPGGTVVKYGAYNVTRDGSVHLGAIANWRLNTGYSAYKLFRNSQTLATYAAPLWRNERTEAYRHDLKAMLALVADGLLSPLIGATYPLERAADAHRTLETRAVAGKIVLVPAG